MGPHGFLLNEERELINLFQMELVSVCIYTFSFFLVPNYIIYYCDCSEMFPLTVLRRSRLSEKSILSRNWNSHLLGGNIWLKTRNHTDKLHYRIAYGVKVKAHSSNMYNEQCPGRWRINKLTIYLMQQHWLTS